MRIQETNEILKDAQTRRNDHPVETSESPWVTTARDWTSKAASVARRPQVLASVGALVVGVAGALLGREISRRR